MTAPDAVAYFDGWLFTTNLTRFECASMGNAACRPPNAACARDPNTSRRYCCDGPPERKRVCWTLETPCRSDGSTIDCTDGKRRFCCFSGSEKCSETPGQAAGICWSTHHDPLNNITIADLTRVHSRLNASRPRATSLTFDLLSIVSATATAPFATASGPPPTSTPGSSETTPAPQPTQTSSEAASSLSGGAIAGIVIGALAGLAILAGLVFLFLRRRKKAPAHQDPAGAPAAGAAAGGLNEKAGQGSAVVGAGGASGIDHQQYQQQPGELSADNNGQGPSELPASMPHEMSASPVPTAQFSATSTPVPAHHPSPFSETISPRSHQG